ncbi:ABC transporter permease [Streptomyces sp. NPDC006660]|uniref:ABC transporter permease n=1 Tax=Streptomyces sp. NPDC006660 TaxID=3156901 RepID=UPI0033CB48E1
MTFVDEMKNAVTVRAALLVIGVLGLMVAFIASYAGAFHSPKPKDIPFAVVAPQQISGPLTQRLGSLPGGPLDVRTAKDEAGAARQLRDRSIDGALIVDPRGTTDKLLVASGGGASLAQAVEAIATAAEKAQQRTVKVTDVAPAAEGDSRTLSSFYLVVGWCVGGYLCAAILAISAGARPANTHRALVRLLVLAVYSIAAGLLGSLIIGPVLGALPGSYISLAGLGALVVFAVGATTLAFQGLAGVVGIGLAILVIVVLGNPSAGGAYPYPLLPPFWRTIGPGLPPGAGTWAARSIAYFRGEAVTWPLLVLSIWAVLGSAVTVAMATFRRDREDGPVGAGRPVAPTP